jgi:Tol biopolymer transport system component
VLGALVAIAGTGAAPAAPGGGRQVSVTVHEGTNFAVAASPDRRRIVIDMQNALWSLPFGGGRARKLTNNLTPATQPDFSPDGRTIFFQGYVGNNFHIRSIRPDGAGLRRLTSGPYDDREPRVSPDGRQVAFSSDRGGSYDIWLLDLAGGGITRLTTTPSQESQPAWSPDGRMLAFVVDNTRVDARDASGAVRAMFAAPAGTSVAAPSWAPDGVRIAYSVSHLTAGPLAPSTSAGLPNPERSRLFVSPQPVSGVEDVFSLRPRWLSDDELLYGADGKIRRRSLARGSASTVRFSASFSFRRPRYAHRPRSFRSTARQPVRGIADPVLSPDGRRVTFRALDDLWVMRIGGAPHRITHDGFSEFRPMWSPDGRQIAYSSDRAGIEQVWIHDLASGRDRRVTRGGAAKLVGAWSRDGGRIAYMDSVGATSGVWTVDVRSGQTTQVHAPLFLPGRPTWSADGRTIALAALVPFSRRFREGLNQILSFDLAGGADRYTDPIPFKSLSDRFTSGPVW